MKIIRAGLQAGDALAGSGNLSVVASAGEKRRKGYAYGVG